MKNKKPADYVKKNSKGEYYCDIKRPGGYRLQSPKCSTKGEVVRLIEQFFIKIELEEKKNKKDNTIINVNQLFNKYLENMEQNITDSTKRNIYSIHKNYINSNIGECLLEELDLVRLNDWCENIKEKKNIGSQITPYMEKVFSLLANVLKFGI